MKQKRCLRANRQRLFTLSSFLSALLACKILAAIILHDTPQQSHLSTMTTVPSKLFVSALMIPSRSTSFVNRHQRTIKKSPNRIIQNSSDANDAATDPITPQQKKKKRLIASLKQSIYLQYQQRKSADPNFISKSIAEVITAAGTQLTAEVSRRGINRIGPEIDFVIAGLLTAVAGKYYSMWMVAPTSSVDDNDDDDEKRYEATTPSKASQSWRDDIPTNAFQSKLLNGQIPTVTQRLLSLLVPIPSLFKAGIIASAIGYGFTSILIGLRSIIIPSYVPQTVNVNVLYASLFTGAFMATVSNIRYQLLQGVIEPKIVDRMFGTKWPKMEALVVLLVRWANGLLGSTLAIMGMKYFGVQRLK